MNRLKSLYVSAYIGGSVAGLAVSLVMLARDGIASPWLGTLLASAAPAAFFARVFASFTPAWAPHFLVTACLTHPRVEGTGLK